MKIINQTKNKILIGNDIILLKRKKGALKDCIISSICCFTPIAYLISGFPLTLLSLGVTRFTCDRPESNQVNCQLSTPSYAGLTSKVTNYKFVKAANLQEVEEDSSLSINGTPVKTTIYSLKIQTKAGEHDLLKTEDAYFASDLNIALNDFLISQQNYLSFVRDNNSNVFKSFIVFLATFCVLCLLSIFFALYSQNELTLDKSQNVIMYREKMIFKKEQFYIFPLTEIVGINIKECVTERDDSDDSDDSDYHTWINVEILFSSNINIESLSKPENKLELDRAENRQTALATANQLRKFLDLPIETEPSK